MAALFLTLALVTCEHYSRNPENAILYEACTMALDADIGTAQLTQCVQERDGSTTCDFFVYGLRRLPFEPMR